MPNIIYKTVSVYQEYCRYCKCNGKFENQVCPACVKAFDGYIPSVDETVKHFSGVEFEILEGVPPEDAMELVAEDTYEYVADMDRDHFEAWFDLWDEYGFLSQESIDKVQAEFNERGLVTTIHTGPLEGRFTSDVTFLGIYRGHDQVIGKMRVKFSEQD